MKRIIFLAAIVVLSVGCSKTYEEQKRDSYNDSLQGWKTVIPIEDRKEAKEFCLQCVKNNTPTGAWHGSSPEDIVRQCERTSLDYFGKSIHGTWYRETSSGFCDQFVPDADK